MIEGTVHRVFRRTSNWEKFDKAIEINRKQWLDNQYPQSWSSRVASHALKKIIGKKKADFSSRSLPILVVQDRGHQSQTKAKKSARYHQCADNIHDAEIENLFFLFKSSFSSELKSKGCTILNVVGANHPRWPDVPTSHHKD